MKITRISPLTGQEKSMDLAVTEEQLAEFEQPISSRRLIQDIFPNLTDSEREFIKSGYTDEDWNVLFSPKEK